MKRGPWGQLPNKTLDNAHEPDQRARYDRAMLIASDMYEMCGTMSGHDGAVGDWALLLLAAFRILSLPDHEFALDTFVNSLRDICEKRKQKRKRTR